MPAAVPRRARRNPWSTHWSPVQTCSHVATFYSITSYAVVVQPAWMDAGGAAAGVLLVVFWCDFVVCLLLYVYVCLTDTRYYEARQCEEDCEPRRCEDCDCMVARRRVKHCQSCGRCTLDFDHHCRYLNVCIGGKTYRPWFAFVATLLGLTAMCSYSAVDALVDEGPDKFLLGAFSPPAFYTLVGLQAVLSLVESTFLVCLMVQHMYFICEGITTLEYIKDQAPGFPSLPPKGWRQAVLQGECFKCGDELEVTEIEDPAEVWFCTVCQADLSKASVEFLSCDVCDGVNVCPLCRHAAQRNDLVTTHRAATLRRRSMEIGGLDGVASSYSPVPRGASFRSGRSRASSVSGQREARRSRRMLGAMLAGVEGHTGETKVMKGITCGQGAEDAQEVGQGDDEDDDTSDASDGSYESPGGRA